MSILHLKNASLAFGLHALLDHADLTIERGEHVALIGRNGAGKSSLLRVAAGDQQLDDGECRIHPGAVVAHVMQETQFDPDSSVLDIVKSGIPETIDEWNHNHMAETAIDSFDLSPSDRFGDLSGGEKKRVALAHAIAAQPDVLLLDEPTNHLDIDAIELLEKRIKAFSGAVIVISHDRRFLDQIADEIVELDRGQLRTYPGNYAKYRQRKQDELQAEIQQNEKFDKFLKQEEAWIRKGVEARRTRNEGRVRRLEELRRQRAMRREAEGRVQFSIDAGALTGKVVVEFSHVTKHFAEKHVIDDLSFRVLRGERVGIVGPNGSGKSTMLKLMLGEISPDSGKINRGTNLSIAYFDQMRTQLKPEATLIETVSQGGDYIDIGGNRMHVVTYLGDFLFSPERARAKVGSLSGGERNRLLLARIFSQPANVLVLDEPTNDLDIETLELLEERLIDYPGTVFLVSHDRTFLDNITTQVIATTGNGKWTSIIGGFSDWEAWKKSHLDALKEAQKQSVQKAAANNPSSAPKTARERQRAAKLTFNEKRELAALPGMIERLEAEQESILTQLNDPSLYKENADKIRPLQARLSQIETELDTALNRWTELEMKES